MFNNKIQILNRGRIYAGLWRRFWSNFVLIDNLFYSFISKEANVKNTDNRGYKLGKLLQNPKSFGLFPQGLFFETPK